MASLLRGGFRLKILFEVVENVFEPGKIFWRCVTQRLVRIEHLFRLLLFAQSGLLQFLTLRSVRAVCRNLEELVEAKTAEELATALATMDDLKVTFTELAQAQGESGHCSHEGRVHHGAIMQVHNELTVAAIDHLARELFEVPAVQKSPFALYPHPHGRAAYPDLDR
jgi:hypothetical protein